MEGPLADITCVSAVHGEADNLNGLRETSAETSQSSSRSVDPALSPSLADSEQVTRHFETTEDGK